jgi:hypothetical protein
VWVNPNRPRPEPEPPRDEGYPLASFPRWDGEELRVSLAEYKGHPYVSLRVWWTDPAGRAHPLRGKGVSVRLGEIAGVVDALLQAGDLAAPVE